MNTKAFNRWCDVRGIGKNTRETMILEMDNRDDLGDSNSEDTWLKVYNSLVRYYLYEIFYSWY